MSRRHDPRMLLRSGVKVATVLQGLQGLIITAHNLATSDDENYVLWIAGLEVRFSEWFSDVPASFLFSERFWQINAGVGPRPHEMRRQEHARVVALLQALESALKEMASRFGEPARAIAVLDTNVLLHHAPLPEVDWADVVAESVTLVVPFRVIAEMDDKKASRSDKLADRARSRLRMLEPFVLSDGATSAVRPGVDLAVVGTVDLDPEARRRPPGPPDIEILDTCEALAAYGGTNPVCLVTGDLAMHARAKSLGIPVRRMPERYYQRLGQGETAA